ncbi:tetratricopeptide repeat protein [Pseudomonas gingeri]
MSREDEDLAALLKSMGELYRRNGQTQRALVMLLIAVQVTPGDSELLRNLAMAFTDSGDGVRALAALDRLRDLEGESRGELLLRSRALWVIGNEDDARLCFKRYLAARRAEQ